MCVFDIFIFSCVFSGVDSSMPALELARENVALNMLDPEKISFLKEDVTQFMKGALSRNESWDLVILDPPKLAPRKKVRHSRNNSPIPTPTKKMLQFGLKVSIFFL